MLSYSKLVVPGIAILVMGGIIAFLFAYSFYPEKHINVNIDGKCYELLDNSNEDYKILRLDYELQIKKMQLEKIDEGNFLLPVFFSGYTKDVNEFIKKYNIVNIISEQNITDNPNYNKLIIKALIPKQTYENIVNNLTLFDLYPFNSVAGSIGLEPNKYITFQEGKEIFKESKQFLENGIREIIKTNNIIKQSECRYKS